MNGIRMKWLTLDGRLVCSWVDAKDVAPRPADHTPTQAVDDIADLSKPAIQKVA